MRGTAVAAIGAVAFAVSIVLSRQLAVDGLRAPTVFGIRFALAGVLTVGVLVVTRRSLVPVRGERIAAVLLGTVGYFCESLFFFFGLERGTAAMVALLFYAYPALVVLLETSISRSLPSGRTIGALVLSMCGAGLIVVTGGNVDITWLGIVFALAAAGSFAIYLVVSQRTVRRTGPLTNAAWVTLGAGLSHLVRGVIIGGLQDPSGHAPALFGNAVATVVAFTAMFGALRYLSASHTAVIMTLEALATIVLAWLFLNEALGPLQIVGGIVILVAAVLISTAREDRRVEWELDDAASTPP